MFITPYFGGCKYTNNFLFINKNPVFQCFGLLITPSVSHFPFSSFPLFLPSYSPELLPAIPDSFSTPDPSPVPVAVHPPRHTLQAATIFAGFPEQLPPFSKESQVILDSCHLFPAKNATALQKVTDQENGLNDYTYIC